MLEDLDMVGAAIGRIPSGCSILTVDHDGSSTGVLVSWVQQASFDPPNLTVCLKRGRPAFELIEASGRFLLNVIGEDATPLFKHFGRGFTLEDEAFSGLAVRETPYGPLIESSIAHLGCKVMNMISVGDHELVVGEIGAAGIVEGAKPYVHLRKNGLSY
jgi:flavin reductase (DIM6/NTAB) family NADH-FMN oxidoreductase RutF